MINLTLLKIEEGDKNGRNKINLSFSVTVDGETFRAYLTTYEDFLENIFPHGKPEPRTVYESATFPFERAVSKGGNVYYKFGKNSWCFDKSFLLTPVSKKVGRRTIRIKTGAEQLTEIISGLNEGQKDVIFHKGGQLLCVAGAGSGKTHTLIAKVADLVLNDGEDPTRILVTTFTRKAGDELKVRLKRFIHPAKVQGMSVGTFHSILLRLLRDHYGKGSPFDSLIGGSDSKFSPIKIVAQIIGERNEFLNCKGLEIEDAEPTYFTSAISLMKNSLIYPGDEDKITEMYEHPSVAPVYAEYERTKKALNVADLDDILLHFYTLMKADKTFRAKCEGLFKWVFVDEAQDNNLVQIEIARMLSKKSGNLVLVGDDWQSIYKFRGAVPEFMIKFETHYPGSSLAYMVTNYRSVPEVVDLGNSLIVHNQNQIEKECNSNRNSSGIDPEVMVSFDPQGESETVVQKIISEELKFDETAIIYRVNATSAFLETALIRQKIPYRVEGGRRFFERAEVMDAIAYFKLAIDPHDNDAFYRVFDKPRRGLGKKFIERIKREAGADGSYFDAMMSLQKNRRYKKGIEKFAETIKNVLSRKSVYDPEDDFANTVDVPDTLLRAGGVILSHFEAQRKDGGFTAEEGDNSKSENVAALVSVSNSFDGYTPDKFYQYIAEVNRPSSSRDAVTLMTSHKSKGLEFPNVIIASCNSDQFPHWKAAQDGPDGEGIEEERRLMYVSLTRAKDRLFFSVTKVNAFGKKTSFSPFLDDMGLQWDKETYWGGRV